MTHDPVPSEPPTDVVGTERDRGLLVPRTSEITAGWLESALRAGGFEASIRAVRAAPVGHGMLATTVRLDVEYFGDTELPSTFVLKYTGPGEISRHTGKAGFGFPGRPGFYAREVEFYRNVGPRTRIRYPRCYWSSISQEGGDFALLLEDVSPSRPGDESSGCTLEEAQVVMRNLAGLHAPFWNDPAFDADPGWSFSRLTEKEAASFARKTTRNAAKVYSQVSGRLWTENREIIDRFAAASARWIRGLDRPITLTHTDFRLDNILFPEPQGGEGCVVVDWQTIMGSSPGRDLGLILGASMPREMAKENLTTLLSTYHSRLVELGVTTYTEEQCYDDFRHGLFQGLHNVLTVSLSVEMTDRGSYLMEHWFSRACDAIREHDALEVLS